MLSGRMQQWPREWELKGIEKGIERGKIEVAKNLFALGIDINKISQATNLSLEYLEKLKIETNKAQDKPAKYSTKKSSKKLTL